MHLARRYTLRRMSPRSASSPFDSAGPGAIPAETLSELLRELARRQPEHEALVYPGFTLGGAAVRQNFAQLDARVDEVLAETSKK